MTIEIEYIKGVLFIRINGSIDKNTLFKIDDINNRIVKRVGIKNTLINVEKVKYIDSHGYSSINSLFNNSLNNVIVGEKYNSNLVLKKDIFKNVHYLNTETEALRYFKA